MKTITTVILAIVLCAASTWAGSGESVEVRIVTDDGRSLPTYPVKQRSGIRKFYAEAVKGDHYRVEVKNRLNRRVGLVIAVDGRNIISGGKSWLKNSERMYILEPYGSGEYAGWRSTQDRINRFYFTEAPDSYAAAFGDESAMGVIAVAVYPELQRYQPPPMTQSQAASPYPRGIENRVVGGAADSSSGAGRAGTPAPAGESMKKKAARSDKAMESAGTGYGRDEYSPTRIVAFEAENRAVETIYLKYEWRTTLCKLGVVDCYKPPRRPPNRLWDNGGYAPPPPGRS